MESRCHIFPSNNKPPRYDITMSKRTRKPLNLEEEEAAAAKQIPTTEDEDDDEAFDAKVDPHSQEEDEEEDKAHKSLKQLINGKEEEDNNKLKSICKGSSRSALGQHFTDEEKQLQLVRKQNEDGMKLKGMMGRYVKVLSHLIKVKRFGSRKKPSLRLAM